MLSRIFSVEDYIEWAKYYFELEDRLNIEDVKKVFNHKPIAENIIRKLNPDRNMNETIEELVKIKYPVEYKF